jgi:hypothetical protein
VIVVSNASPLIAGLDIGLGAILEALFGEVFIPPAVRQEVFTRKNMHARSLAAHRRQPWRTMGALKCLRFSMFLMVIKVYCGLVV